MRIDPLRDLLSVFFLCEDRKPNEVGQLFRWPVATVFFVEVVSEIEGMLDLPIW